MNNYCAACEHFVCGLHGNGYCAINRQHLLYGDEEACDLFTADCRAYRAFELGRFNNQSAAVFVVTSVECVDGSDRDPVNFVFENEGAANACFLYLSRDHDRKVFMSKEILLHKFPQFNNGGGQKNGFV